MSLFLTARSVSTEWSDRPSSVMATQICTSLQFKAMRFLPSYLLASSINSPHQWQRANERRIYIYNNWFIHIQVLHLYNFKYSTHDFSQVYKSFIEYRGIRYRSHRKDCQLPMIFELLYYLYYHKRKKLKFHYKHEIKVIKITI